QIVALADIIEAEQLHHEYCVLSGLNEGEAVMTRIDVEKTGSERFGIIVSQALSAHARDLSVVGQPSIARPRAKIVDPRARLWFSLRLVGTPTRDHDALLVIIHAESERRARLIHALQTEQTGAVAGPVVQSFSADADIT